MYTSNVECVRLLLLHGASVDHVDSLSHTVATYMACGMYLSYGSDPTPLHSLVQILLSIDYIDFGRPVETSWACLVPGLFYYCLPETARLLIGYIDSQDYERSRSLVDAAKADNYETFRILLDCMTETEKEIDQGSILYHASPYGPCSKFEILELLVAKRWNLDQLDRENSLSALHGAALRANPSAMKFLLRKGADPNIHSTADGSTPLHSAARAGSIECVEVLLEYGADISVKNKIGQTPVHESVMCWYPCYNWAATVLLFFLDRGLSASSVDSYGRSPLHILLRQPVDLDLEDSSKWRAYFADCFEIFWNHDVDPRQPFPSCALPDFSPVLLSLSESLPIRNEDLLEAKPWAREVYLDSIVKHFSEIVTLVDGELFWQAEEQLES